MFNEVLRRCMDAGLVKGEGEGERVAVNASIICADASRQHCVPGDEPSTGVLIQGLIKGHIVNMSPAMRPEEPMKRRAI